MRMRGEFVVCLLFVVIGQGAGTDPPPEDLEIDVESGEKAVIRWQTKLIGNYTSYKLLVIPISDPLEEIRNLALQEMQSTLNDLSPGATYEVQLHRVNRKKSSTLFASTNFTTKPNTPGKYIVWFRNETTLLVLWEPPVPSGYFTDYKVIIDPKDADVSETYVRKQSYPLGPDHPKAYDKGGESLYPSQAAFNGLVPGSAYNISVMTLSYDQISDPLTAQYRTVPLRPYNVTFNQASITTDSFTVEWDGPDPSQVSEYDRYQVAIGIRRKSPQIIEKGAPRVAKFSTDILPGRTYQVVVKTVSGSVASRPAERNVTTRPNPVINLTVIEDTETMELVLSWQPSLGSVQDSYKVCTLSLFKYSALHKLNLSLGEKFYFHRTYKFWGSEILNKDLLDCLFSSVLLENMRDRRLKIFEMCNKCVFMILINLSYNFLVFGLI